MSKLTDHIRELPSRRDPPYRPLATIDDAERAEITSKLGSTENYFDLLQLRELIKEDPDNIEFRRAMVSSIASAEYAGVDAFSRKVCEWQDWDVPWSLIIAMARQTWDEVRHSQLATGVLESYGGKIGDYPDTLAGGGPPPVMQSAAGGAYAAAAESLFRDPVASLSMVNVSLEGGALTAFQETSKLGERIGDELLAHCYDYNWADEVTHTAIGDYFVKALCQDDPEQERKALRAHAFFEMSRGPRLNDEQSQELKEFFAEEIQRAHAVLGGSH